MEINEIQEQENMKPFTLNQTDSTMVSRRGIKARTFSGFSIRRGNPNTHGTNGNFSGLSERDLEND